MNMDQDSAPGQESVSDATRVDRICDRFEQAWRDGAQPDVAEYLGDVSEPLRSRLFAELVLSDLECRERAGTPAERGEYLKQFPERCREIDAIFRRFQTDSSQRGVRQPRISEPAMDDVYAANGQCGNYQLLEEIARGGMGIVFRAHDTRLQRTVALKMILDRNLASAEAVQRFYAEAEMAAGLDHPGIVPVYDVGVHEGHHYYAMGFIEGPTLAEKLKRHAYSAHEAARLVIDLARAVAYAHRHGVVHRDLKPGNILLDADGQARITDFGLAKRTDRPSHLTMEGQVLGTPGYMAPEQAKGAAQQSGPAADIYALGAILYHLLTGHPPFRSSLDALVQVLEQDPVPPRVLNRRIPRDLDVICMKCLAKSPADRFQSADELADDLQRFLDGEPIQARRLGWRRATLRWARHRPRLATVWTTLFAIYVYHLICYAMGNPGSLGHFHWLATGTVLLVAAYAWVYQWLLLRPESGMNVLHLWAATDILVFTVFLITAADGAHSPLVVLYLCMVAGAALSFDRHMVWLVTGVSIAAYWIVVVVSPWSHPTLALPEFRETAPVAISMLAIGLIQYYVLRCARLHQMRNYSKSKLARTRTQK